ncbi:hypothetical protein [Thermoactinospora rubra]|uniref:hypothetical protein n=1 Tax=Thermoactinospora rubra TaxID=1088767 RepID=UPI000A10B8DB|nr:hypothetical protein [Thermoactinospora rubra]
MIKLLQRMGIRSSHMYAAGFASIGVSIASWAASKNLEKAGMDRADRWGIFVGEWAPTLFALGVALRMEEMTPQAQMEMETTPRTTPEPTEAATFDKASGGRTPVHPRA